jgi:hypothetical protein
MGHFTSIPFRILAQEKWGKKKEESREGREKEKERESEQKCRQAQQQQQYIKKIIYTRERYMLKDF